MVTGTGLGPHSTRLEVAPCSSLVILHEYIGVLGGEAGNHIVLLVVGGEKTIGSVPTCRHVPITLVNDCLSYRVLATLGLVGVGSGGRTGSLERQVLAGSKRPRSRRIVRRDADNVPTAVGVRRLTPVSLHFRGFEAETMRDAT